MLSDDAKESVGCRRMLLLSPGLYLMFVFCFHVLLLAMIRTTTALISRSAALRYATLRSHGYLNPSLRTIVILLKLSAIIAFVVLLFSPLLLVEAVVYSFLVVATFLLFTCILYALIPINLHTAHTGLTSLFASQPHGVYVTNNYSTRWHLFSGQIFLFHMHICVYEVLHMRLSAFKNVLLF